MLKTKAAAALLLCALLLAGCSQPQAAAPIETLPTARQHSYKTTPVTRGTFSLTVSANASFVYPEAVTLTCEYNNAILKDSVLFLENAIIQKGDVIATYTFDASPAELERLELACYQANLSAANQIASYESRIAQYTQAAAAGGIDGQIAALQLEKARNELKIYKEKTYRSLAQQEAELEAYRDLFNTKTLLAPEDGMVLAKFSLDAGTVLKKGAKLITYTTGTPRLLKLTNPNNVFHMLATPGTEVTISRGDREITGTIVASPVGISDSLDNMNVYVDSPELDTLELRNYYKVDCTILTVKDVLFIKSSAIHYDEGSAYVMVLENGQAVRKEVLCGLEDNGQTVILDGLEAGQLAILNY